MSGGTWIINGWSIYAHPVFVDQLEALIADVEAARLKDPQNFQSTRSAKILKATIKVAFTVIPSDPANEAFRQGGTLGPEYKHWMRAKYLQQYRLFFRYRQSGSLKIIVLGWVNDEKTLRAYGSKTDAYLTFRKMLKQGRPPDDWGQLLAEAMEAKKSLNELPGL